MILPSFILQNQDENQANRQDDINNTEPHEPPPIKQKPQVSIMDKTLSREALNKILVKFFSNV